MGTLREWLFSVITVSGMLAVAQTLVPEGTVRKIASFTGGLILMVTLLQPLPGMAPERFELRLEHYRQEIESRQRELEGRGAGELTELIKSRTAAYIMDKADALGLRVQVRILMETGADGIPVPVAAELTGEYSEALSAYLERDLGIPAERQVWHEN